MAEPPKTLVDWLDDLTVRFLLNLPKSELESIPRLCFQVEEAQWFYEDFVRPAAVASGLPPLPSLPLRSFCLMLFQHCPLLSGYTSSDHIRAYEEFLAYKVRVPVRGAILLDEKMEKVVLVRGWKKGASWSFPRGKINKDERDLDCAIREVYEETGYDVRQAGLVPDNENEVKYIDITMREQHMRLFVFRGVREDTYFEPKTRKEISKIQWYAIRDLPGFKKYKPGQQGADAAVQANKFYMVAPFLGPLKKWIGLQKRKDQERAAKEADRNGYAAQMTTTEDEADVEEELTPERNGAGVDESSEALKRLLSIGGSAPEVAEPSPGIAKPDAGSADLLSLLRGAGKPANGNQMPHTPFEQINTFPQEPQTPQPDHLRHPSITHQQQQYPPPQFPFSPPGAHQQEQQWNFSMPTPNIFGPPQQGPPPPNSQGPLPPYPTQQPFQQRQSMPGPPPGFLFDQQHGSSRLFNGMPGPSAQPHQIPPPHVQQQRVTQAPPQHVFPWTAPQGPQGAIAAGPGVPNASQLPPPRLNANAMKLLDAFRNGGRNNTEPAEAPATRNSGPEQSKQRPASSHQAALLDLFRKPSENAIPPPAEEAKIETVEPASPTLTDVTVKPAKPPKRKTTLNEITRTLPGTVKSKSPAVTEAPVQPLVAAQPPVAQLPAIPPQTLPEKPKERQLFDPDSKTFISAPKESSPQRSKSTQPHVLQQPSLPKRPSRSPKPKYATTSSSPSRKAATNGTHSTPQFTILPRPGSARGPKAPVAPPSPLKIETEKPAFQPQVLKRPQSSNVAPEQPVDKKDQLLALFGKAPAKSTTTPPVQPPVQSPSPPARQPSQTSLDSKNALLGLFDNTPQQTTPSPTPPPAPKIEPEQPPTSSKQNSTGAGKPQPQPQQQSILLDLFNKRNTGSPITSPGTPISPFTLGTPAGAQSGQPLPFGPASSIPSAEPRSRLGSVTSVSSLASDKTPTETREFLMGYLKNVVSGEGQRGSGKR